MRIRATCRRSFCYANEKNVPADYKGVLGGEVSCHRHAGGRREQVIIWCGDKLGYAYVVLYPSRDVAVIHLAKNSTLLLESAGKLT